MWRRWGAVLAILAIGGVHMTEVSMADDNKAVRAAVDQWFVVLNAMLNGDPEPFAGLYSHGDDVTYMGAEGTLKSVYPCFSYVSPSPPDTRKHRNTGLLTMRPRKRGLSVGCSLGCNGSLAFEANQPASARRSRVSTNIFCYPSKQLREGRFQSYGPN